MMFGNTFLFLNEEVVYKGNGILISIDGSGSTDRSFDKDPYFKVYNSESMKKANKVCTMRIISASYMKAHRRGGLDTWYPNSKEMDKIITALNSKPNGDKKVAECDSTWDGLIQICKNKYKDYEAPEDMPDYRKLI